MNWLRQRRQELNLSQEALAERMQLIGYDITAGAISHYERGRYNAPLEKPRFRNALTRALKLTEPELLIRAGYLSQLKWTNEAAEAAQIVNRLPTAERLQALRILRAYADTTGT